LIEISINGVKNKQEVD